MATIMTQGNSEGTRRCDGTCHNAKTPKCSCICGGRYHGAGKQAHEMLTRDWLGEDWREKKAEIEAAGGTLEALVQTALSFDRLRVGDLVTVAKASGVNAAHVRAVVVEAYTLGGRDGWMLLFEDGRYDGFSPEDCATFGVAKAGCEPTIARYYFTNVTRLTADYRAGRFAAAFLE